MVKIKREYIEKFKNDDYFCDDNVEQQQIYHEIERDMSKYESRCEIINLLIVFLIILMLSFCLCF